MWVLVQILSFNLESSQAKPSRLLEKGKLFTLPNKLSFLDYTKGKFNYNHNKCIERKRTNLAYNNNNNKWKCMLLIIMWKLRQQSLFIQNDRLVCSRRKGDANFCGGVQKVRHDESPVIIQYKLDLIVLYITGDSSCRRNRRFRSRKKEGSWCIL